MTPVSRREFIKAIAASAGLFAAGRTLAGVQSSVLQFLVVGDSLIWGQGLPEKDKFYSLTADWLRKEAFGRPRNVDLKVKAHSGANLKYHPETAERFKKAGLDDSYRFHPEVNVGWPSIWHQIEEAAAEYKRDKKGAADLIMLSGGITDISVTTVLDPYGDDKKLLPLIEKYCRDDMLDVLRHADRNHPDAVIAVIGYYPMLSPKSPGSKLMDVWLETMGFPDSLKPVANNPVTRRLFFNRLRRKVLGRSRIWTEGSNRNLQLAVDMFNTGLPRKRAIFVKSPITEETTYETPNTLVFRMGKDGESEDPLAAARSAECKRSFDELKRKTGLENSVRRCEIAGIGHPDPSGSRAYYDEIRNAIANESSIIRRLALAR
jgi:hypothetical protein